MGDHELSGQAAPGEEYAQRRQVDREPVAAATLMKLARALHQIQLSAPCRVACRVSLLMKVNMIAVSETWLWSERALLTSF